MLLDAALRRTVLACTCALLAALALAFAPGDAQAIDQWGPLGHIDGRDGSLQQAGGVAIAPDASAFYVVDTGQATKTDSCGESYTPFVVHRYVLNATHTAVSSTSSVTLDGSLPFHDPIGTENSLAIAVAKDGSQQVLLLGFTADPNAGAGSCDSSPDPALLTELDASTLTTVRTLDRAALRGLNVDRVSVAPGRAGGADSVWMVGDDGVSGDPPELVHWNGVPGVTTATSTTYPLLPGSTNSPSVFAENPATPTCFSFWAPTATSMNIAAEPDGSALLQAGGQWGTCADLGGMFVQTGVWHLTASGVLQQPAIKTYLGNLDDPATDPLPVGGQGSVLTGFPPLSVDPSTDDMFMGEFANNLTGISGGVQQLDSSGNLIRAWGPQPPDVVTGYGTDPDCADTNTLTNPNSVRYTGLYLAAASGIVVTANAQPYDATAAAGTSGPLISWMGAGTVGPRCLLTPRPTTTMTVTPGGSAHVGDTLTMDASASEPNTTPAINADNKLTYQFETGASGWGPSTTNPVFTMPLTKAGEYPLGVLVTDSYGQQAQYLEDYNVYGAPPDPVLTASDLTPTVGELVTLSGAQSTSTGQIMNYKFDLDGSGAFVTDNLSNPTLTYKFTQAGPVTVGLRVKDNLGQTVTTTLRIDVQPAPPPPPLPVPPTGSLAPLPGGGSQFGAGGGTAKPSAALRPARVPSEQGRLKVGVACLAGGARCTGTLWLTNAHGKRISNQSRFGARPGYSTGTQPLLSAAARKLLRHNGKLSARVVARLALSNGATVTEHVTRSLGRPPAWAPKKKSATKTSTKS